MNELAKWVDAQNIDLTNPYNVIEWIDHCMDERNEIVKKLDASPKFQTDLRLQLVEVHGRMRYLNLFLENLRKTA